MSVPTHAEILRAANELADAMAVRMLPRARTYARRSGSRAGYRTGRQGEEWQRLIPDVEAVRSGDPDAVEHAIVFLEADPWCFRSGYEKEQMLLALRRPVLTRAQQDRLDAAVLRLVHTARREVGAARRLVRVRRGARLKPALRQLVAEADDDVALRAFRMLIAAGRPRLEGAAARRARQLMELRLPWWSMWSQDETRRAVAALWDAEWEASLIRIGGDGSVRALELLALLPSPAIAPRDRPALVRPIMRMLHGRDDTALRLLVPAWCDELSSALVEMADDHLWGDRITALIVDGPPAQ